MIRKLVICAIIALILVPAGVLAAGPGGQNTGTASGQGQCLHNGQNCVGQSGMQGVCNQTGCQYGTPSNGTTGTTGCMNGQGTHRQNHARSATCQHDGSCAGCKNGAVTQP